MPVSEQEFGSLLGSFQALQREVTEMKADSKAAFKEIKEENKSIAETLDGILGRFDRFDGGWKVLIFIGGIAGTAGGILTAVAIKAWPMLLGALPRI